MTMVNTCNYSDEWQPYIGEYDKFEYDIKLKDGRIVTNCYPNAGIFSSLSDEYKNEEIEEREITQIRFSQKLRWLISKPENSKGEEDFEYRNRILYNFVEEESYISGLFDNSIYRMTEEYINYYNDYEYIIDENPTRKKYKGVVKRVEPSLGLNRNDKCPCGSGKKYKKCCL